MRRWSVAFIAALCAVLYLAPAAAPSDVTSEVLPNGMKVLVREDHKAPVVISQLWVKVGSNYETPEVLGCSHLIEHMIFNKGTAKRGVGQMSREVAEAGGLQNAGTGYETTSYFVTVPSENFDVALDVQADALISASFDAAELDKEREVVIEENKMYSDIPDGYGETWNRLMTKAFTVSPYRRSIGGPEEVLRAASRDDILSYKKHYYVPSNMTLVIVGDIETGDVLRKVRAAYAGFDGPPPFQRHYEMEPPQTAFRYMAYSGDVSQVYMKFGYQSVPEMAEDQPAFAVMSKVLAGSRSSRIHQSVREKQGLISSVEVLSENGPRQGYFVLDVVADAPKVAAAEEAILHEIERLKAGIVTEKELVRARNLVLRDFLFAMETVDGQAQNLGFYDAMGDHTYALRYPDLVRAVTAADAMAAARRYLDLSGLTLAVYYPASAEGQIETDGAAVRGRLEAATLAGAAGPVPMGQLVRVRAEGADLMAPGMTVRAGAPAGCAPKCVARPCDKSACAARCEAAPCCRKAAGAKSCCRPACRGEARRGETTLFGWLRENIGKRVFGGGDESGAGTAAGPRRFDLSNGLTLVVKENHSVPVVALGAFARVGVRDETPATNGIAPLTQRTMLKGTRARNAAAIAGDIEVLGGNLSPFAAADASGCFMTILAERFVDGFAIFADVLLDPTFPEEEIQRERGILKAEIEAQRDNTVAVALQEYRKLVFGAHPYGLPRLGTPESLDGLTRTDLVTWHKDHYAPNNLVLCVAGDVRADEVRDLVERAFGPLPSRPVPAPPSVVIPPPAARETVSEKDVQQDVLVMGGLAPKASDPAGRVMELISAALEGSGNRLFMELRDRRSLCYYTGLFYHPMAEAGLYGGYIGTSPAKEGEARTALAGEIRSVARDGLTADEIARAKSTLIGNFAIEMQSNAAQVQQIASDVLLGRGHDALSRYAGEIRGIAPEDVRAVASGTLDMERPAISVVRPPSL